MDKIKPIGQEWLDDRMQQLRYKPREVVGPNAVVIMLSEVACELAHIAMILDQIRDGYGQEPLHG